MQAPQENGVAEAGWGTLLPMSMAAMRSAARSPGLWAESLFAALHVETLLSRNGRQSAYEAWYGEKPTIDHLRVWGSPAWIHVPESKRVKLDDRAAPFIFVGYESRTCDTGYRLLHPVTGNITVSQHVVFDEAWGSLTDHRTQRSAAEVPDHADSAEDSDEDAEDAEDWRADDSLPDLVDSSDDEDDADAADDDSHVSLADSDDDGAGRVAVPAAAHAGRAAVEERTPSVGTSLSSSVPSSAVPSSSLDALRDHPVTALQATTDAGPGGPPLLPDEPRTYQEAISSPQAAQWQEAMEEEYRALELNQTFEIVQLPRGRKALPGKWVYKLKLAPDGSVARHKARFVVKGCLQKAGVDYAETFAPVARFASYRVLTAVAAAKRWFMEQLDFNTAFLNARPDVEVYVRPPRGFEPAVADDGSEKRVWRLLRALYGLKQAPRAWYALLHAWLVKWGLHPSAIEPCMYVRKYPDGTILVALLYVDDMIITGDNDEQRRQLMKDLAARFKLKQLGQAHWILGMRLTSPSADRSQGIHLDQGSYTRTVLHRFHMDKSKPVATPAQLGVKLGATLPPPDTAETSMMKRVPFRAAVGALLYAASATRPDIKEATRAVARFCNAPRRVHWVAVKRILRYLAGSLPRCLRYAADVPCILHGFCDSDWASAQDTRRSVSGFIFGFPGSAPFAWSSKTQRTVALSTAEAEYYALSAAVQEALYLRQLLSDLGCPQSGPTIIYCDNQATIAMAENPTHHSRAKHIAIRHHFLRDHVQAGTVKIHYIASAANQADFLTKPVPAPVLLRTLQNLRM